MSLIVHPDDLVILPAYGTGNMGSVTDIHSTCRFRLDADRWCLRWIRVGFVGGSGEADLAICVDNGRMAQGLRDTSSVLITSPYDFTLYTIEDVGVASWRGQWRAEDSELADYVFQRGDVLVLTWTNPSTTRWGVEVALVDTAKIGRL